MYIYENVAFLRWRGPKISESRSKNSRSSCAWGHPVLTTEALLVRSVALGPEVDPLALLLSTGGPVVF